MNEEILVSFLIKKIFLLGVLRGRAGFLSPKASRAVHGMVERDQYT